MKPHICKTLIGRYVCEIPFWNQPEEGAPDEEWWVYAACGFGDSPVEAYNEWLKDWEEYV